MPQWFYLSQEILTIAVRTLTLSLTHQCSLGSQHHVTFKAFIDLRTSLYCGTLYFLKERRICYTASAVPKPCLSWSVHLKRIVHAKMKNGVMIYSPSRSPKSLLLSLYCGTHTMQNINMLFIHIPHFPEE